MQRFGNSMNCFELIKQVLDDDYQRIQVPDKDLEIGQRVVELRELYRRIYEDGLPGNYDDPLVRFAYVYKYTTANAMALYNVLSACPNMAQLLGSSVELTAIGGGPGSDFLGLLKYLRDQGPSARVTGFLLDNARDWYDTWCDIFRRLGSDLSLSLSFDEVDVCDASSCDPQARYLARIIHELDERIIGETRKWVCAMQNPVSGRSPRWYTLFHSSSWESLVASR